MPLQYVGIRVSNLERSLRFYTEVLGLREKIRGDNRSEGRGIWVGLEDPRSRVDLELNWYPRSSPFGTPFRTGGALDHIGFRLGAVPRKKLEAEYRRLLDRGARPTRIRPADTNGWMACVRDPDGNWIEIFRTPTLAEKRREHSRTAP
jgi:catechol 2,3-dioxygenase-like lactoylglutathione lyase family enzyme